MKTKLSEYIINCIPEHDARDKGEGGSYHKIVSQIEEDDPDISVIGILFSLSLMSVTYAVPRGYSENEFVPDVERNLGYFIKGLEFKDGKLHFSSDYISRRMIKIEIVYESGGKVTLTAINRGKSADRWMTILQGKRRDDHAGTFLTVAFEKEGGRSAPE